MLSKGKLTNAPLVAVLNEPITEGEKIRCVYADIRIIAHKRTLIIDLYHQDQCETRMFFTNEDYISCRNGQWSKKNIFDLYHDIIYYSRQTHKYSLDIVYGDRESQLKIMRFLKGNTRFYDMIYDYQSKIRSVRRNKVKSKQRKKAKTVNATVKRLPKRVMKFTHDTVMGDRHYLFYEQTFQQKNERTYECHCSYCNKDYCTVSGAAFIHKAKGVCEKCGHRITYQSVKRMKKVIFDKEWLLVPDITSKQDIVLRYVYQVRTYTKETYKEPSIETTELARVFLGLNGNIYQCYEYLEGEWRLSLKTYLTCRWYYYNNYCENCYLYPYNIDRIFHICEEGKYLSVQNFAYYISDKRRLMPLLFSELLNKKQYKRETYEKLLKLGYNKLVDDMLFNQTHWSYLNPDIFDYQAKSFNKMLRLSKDKMKLFDLFPDYNALQFLQKSPDNLSEKDYKRIVDLLGYDITIFNKLHGMTLNNVLKYIDKNKDKRNPKYFINEWSHYVDMIEELSYPLSEINVFPKNFLKADARVSKEYAEYKEEKEKEKMAEYNISFEKLSNALNEMVPKRFKENASGLQIVIPSSTEDLKEESKQLGHCVASYIGDVANGKTSIFFIRKIDSPDKSYFTMEYKNGKILQLEGKGHARDTQGDVTALALQFGSFLNKIEWTPEKLLAA